MHLRTIFIIVLAIIQCGCTGQQIESKPLSAAYYDGFEVVVKHANGAFSSRDLKEAELLLNDGASFILDVRDIDKIQYELEKNSQQKKEHSHPFVKLHIEQDNDGVQHIRLSYHFSKFTYTYSYKATHRNLLPISSGYKDLNRNSLVYYK